MIESPAFETRVAILKKKARIHGITLPDNCLQFLAENLDSSIREIEGAITKVAGYARLVNRPITLALVKEALRDLLTVGQRKITIQNIIDVVCEHYEVKLSDLQSKGRKQTITFPRQVCMHLARKLTKHSLEEIGGYFGGRDHTTVLHADEKIRRLAEEEVSLRSQLDRFTAKLRS
jgi:chromosomal replication initiator protein